VVVVGSVVFSCLGIVYYVYKKNMED